MLIEAIITAIIVSIDGFFTGLALGLKKTKIDKLKLIIISIIPILMAIPVMFLGNYLSKFLASHIENYIGFILFTILAISSYKQIKEENNNSINIINITNSVIIGLTVGIDSSVSAFSLALNNHNPIITPFYFGISHYILIYLGNTLALKYNISKIKITKYLSPILFIIIAITKLT